MVIVAVVAAVVVVGLRIIFNEVLADAFSKSERHFLLSLGPN